MLAQRLFLAKDGVPSPLLNQIKRLAAFQNPEFYKKQSMRLSTAMTPRVISCAEELPDHIALPRGCRSDLEELLRVHGVALDVVDKRVTGMPLGVRFRGKLTAVQESAARALLAHDTGVFVAPPGVGKTVIGTYLVASRACSTLVLVHRQPLLEQWLAQLALFLGVDPKEVGQISGAKRRPTGRLDVAMIQSLVRKDSVADLVAGYGQVMQTIRAAHVDAWKVGMAELIAARDYAPTTANGWLAILRVVMKAAKRQLSLPYLATEGVPSFDVSEHETYTEEEPNALTPDELPAFLAKFREMFPAHYAMVFVGFFTGLRPSSLRPLRRRGDEADVDWEIGRLRVRRSHTTGDEVMRTTKQKRRYGISVPPALLDVLRWHVDTQLATPEQQDSDLLFPAVNGKFRSPSVLNKPLAEVSLELGLGKKITQRAMRRTFNDLTRAAR